MELEELQALIAGNYDDVVKQFTAVKPTKKVSSADALRQLDPTQHQVTDQTARPNKIKTTKDANGNPVTGVVNVARLPIPFQKIIVSRAAAFLCGNPIKMDAQPIDEGQTGLLQVIQKTWDDNKLDYESMGLAEFMMSETECAELWYVIDAPEEYWQNTANEGAKFRLRMRVLAPSLGDTLYPVFDTTGDMIAFGRGYFIKNGDKTVEHFDVYTDTDIITAVKESGWVVTPVKNPLNKIPVVYYSQPLPEWEDVEPLIERFETSISNNADTNDYFGSPILTVEGQVQGFSDKGEQGKIIQLNNGAKAAYLTWQQAPEAIKLENETLMKLIYSMTDTPNISFEEMKSLGVFSGIALKMLFLSPHLKAARKEGIFGKGIQRRINFLKTAMSIVNVKFQAALALTIKPVFEYYLPQNLLETMQVLTEGVQPGTAIMSQETAVRNNPLVTNPDAELELMKKEGTLGSELQTA
ncbi:phage portal protein [Chitinophaga sp. RCC_12]|uniref:phage portal protein n=1 Tax=Chitinophaga sp. RCC_12 TaxID=3239226 RepID=UPI003524B88E